MLSILSLLRIGVGPSSSHTVGPMRIGRMFALALQKRGVLESVSRVVVTFRGSLAWTGKGHATDTATIYGLAGMQPRTFCAEKAGAVLLRARTDKRLDLLGSHEVAFDPDTDIDFDFDTPAGLHPNEMELRAIGPDGQSLLKRTYYSTGGGFVASHARLSRPASNDRVASGQDVPFPFSSAAELLALCDAHGAGIADILLLNEDAHRPRAETLARLDEVAVAMMDCVGRGLVTRGVLPGGLEVQRRAPDLWSRIQARRSNERESLFDYLNAYAMAVNEENAAGGQVVTAPTNGAAGILPAVMRHYCGDGEADGTIDTGRARTFLTVAGGIGLLYKMRASISGAEMGCQGEVGVACSMAAGGLAAVWGGDPPQICQAAEIGMEHNLGLTCDPVGGLVQIPCIERNAIGAVKAVNAARLALNGSGAGKVSLDQVIETMRQTGLDMSSKYKETSQGGLAVNVVEC